MGILTQQLGTKYVISSDSCSAEAPTKRPPKGKPIASYEVWTGEMWSAASADATIFNTLDDADQYVKDNYTRLCAKKSTDRQPARSVCFPAGAPAPQASLAPLPLTRDG